MGTQLPSGTVTFLFTDVEGSTKLLHELGPDNIFRKLNVRNRTELAAGVIPPLEENGGFPR